MAVFTDNFNRANETPLASPWANPNYTAFNLSGNVAVPSNLASDAVATYTTATGTDQYSKANLTITGTAGGGSGIGLIVRNDISANTRYRMDADHATPGGGGNVRVERVLAGVFSTLFGVDQAWTDGDLWELRAVGPASATVVSIYLNGVFVQSATDNSTLASGYPGLSYSSTETSASIDNWEGGDYVSSKATVAWWAA